VMPRVEVGVTGLTALLATQENPVNLIVVGGYSVVSAVLKTDAALFREKVGRLFVVGGHANDYVDPSPARRRLPIAPRLRERFPARYDAAGDARVSEAERAAWAELLVSGQAVIFVPRDISLWSFAAPGVLAGGGACCDFLLRELFWVNLPLAVDRYAAAGQPVLLSSLPALLLAVKPDPFVWMRLFRVVTARVTIATGANISEIDPASESPNLYIVTAIDGQALGAMMAGLLRDGPGKPAVQ